MQLDFAIIADGATQRPDGKTDIFGGGFDTLWAPSVPAVHPQLALVIRLLSVPIEASEPHSLRIVLRSPEGEEIANAEGTIEPAPPEVTSAEESGRISSTLALTFQNLTFEAWGPYEFSILVDDRPLREPLELQMREAPVDAEGFPAGQEPQVD